MNDHHSGNSGENLSAISNQELTRLYEHYDVGSVDFAAVRAEMLRRGYRFQDSTPQAEDLEDEQPSPSWSVRGTKLRYSKGWSLFWEILFLVMGLAVFVALMESAEWEPETYTGIGFGLGAFMIFCLGAMISGARNLANHKTRHPDAARNGLWQIILGVIWALIGTVALILGTKELLPLLEWDAEQFAYLTVALVSLALVCAAFAITLITLGKEMGSTR